MSFVASPNSVLEMAMTKQNRGVVVYGLFTSADEQVRYVGQTVSPLQTRLRHHLGLARRGKISALFSWIRKHERIGETIEIKPLVRDAVQHETEIQVIAFFKDAGANLVNSTIGGEGIVGLPRTPEHQKKIADAQRGQKRGPLTEEHKKLLSAVLKTRTFSEEHRRKISEKRKAQGISTETQAKMRDGRVSSPLWRANCGRKTHDYNAQDERTP